jgi:hypothetical protein
MAAETCRNDAPDFEIPGTRMVHIVKVVTEARIDAALEILRTVQSAGAALEGLTSSLYGDRLDHRLRLSGIGTTQARAVSQQIFGLAGTLTASVDHHILACNPE